MRKRLWIAVTVFAALALLGSAAGAANTRLDPMSFGGESVRADVTANVTSAVSQSHEQATQANDNDETETEADDDDNPQISASTEAAPSGTTSTKPGWGCGDKNHDHSGPPGRPGATPPPGCDKAGSGGQSENHSNSAGTQGNSADHRTTNPSLSNPGKGKGK